MPYTAYAGGAYFPLPAADRIDRPGPEDASPPPAELPRDSGPITANFRQDVNFARRPPPPGCNWRPVPGLLRTDMATDRSLRVWGKARGRVRPGEARKDVPRPFTPRKGESFVVVTTETGRRVRREVAELFAPTYPELVATEGER